MNLQVKTLLPELVWIKRFVESKSTIPILTNVLFDATGNKLTLTATDLEVGGVTDIVGRGNGAWSVAAPVNKLIQYLQKVDDEEVTLGKQDNWLTVKHGSAVSRISGMSKESFPELPAFPEPQTRLGRLALAVKRTAFAISKEDSRFTLNGALLEVDEDEAHLVATDGHRLSYAPLQARGTSKLRAIVRKKALLEAGQFEDDCDFACNDDHLFFTWGARRMIARKLSGNFPDHERVIPKEYPNHINLPVTTALKTLQRVALYADERSRCIRFKIEDPASLTIFASSVEAGEAQGTVPIKPGEITCPLPIETGLNADYVEDFLSRTDKQFVAFCFTDAKSIDAFSNGEGWQYSLMPMRV